MVAGAKKAKETMRLFLKTNILLNGSSMVEVEIGTRAVKRKLFSTFN